ncbi:MAG: metal ABC transporter permease [Armatimonadota bacterium]|nr:metal ABC transporter permease [Armatimonadota bacterium]
MLTEWLQFEFVQNALVAMVLLAAVYPLLGVFVVGQRIAYFSDAVAHSAFTGAAIAALLGLQLSDTLLFTAPLFALLVAWFRARTRLPTETLLVVTITSISALGVAIASLAETPLALSTLLFGDILAIEQGDLWRLFGVDCFAGAALVGLARPLMRISFHRELARAQGVPVQLVETLFLVVLALVIAVGIRVVGILPVSALLVLPAAAARAVAQSMRGMLGVSAIIGALSLGVGFVVALWQPIPPGAAVALTAAVIFVAIALLKPAEGVIA